MADGDRRLLITIHGIRTYGLWQERLERLVKEGAPSQGWTVFHYKYGFFTIFGFLVPPVRWLLARRFRRDAAPYLAQPWDRIDIVAHSFGTYLAASLLRSYRGTQAIHTVILCGSVLKPGFRWAEIHNRAVRRLVNECAIQDRVLLVNALLVLLLGQAGRVGFNGMTGDTFRNRFHHFGHSDYFSATFMREHWLPLLYGDGPISEVDARSPGLLSDVTNLLLNNAEPIKIGLWVLPLGLALLYVGNLYLEAKEQRRLATVNAEVARARERDAEAAASRATREANRAQVALLREAAARTDAEAQQRRAEEENARANKESLIARGRALTIEALFESGRQGGNRRLAELLAIESHLREPTGASESVIRAFMRDSPRPDLMFEHITGIDAICFDETRASLVIADSRRMLSSVSIPTGRIRDIAKLEGRASAISAVPGALIVALQDGKIVKVAFGSERTGVTEELVPSGQLFPGLGLSATPDLSVIAAMSRDGEVAVWSTVERKAQRVAQAVGEYLEFAGEAFVVSRYSQIPSRVCIPAAMPPTAGRCDNDPQWDEQARAIRGLLQGYSGENVRLGATGRGGRVGILSGGAVDVYTMRGSQGIARLLGIPSQSKMRLAPEGNSVVTLGGSEACFWSIPKQALLRCIEHESAVRAAMISNDASLGVTVSTDLRGGPWPVAVLKVWDLATGNLLWQIRHDAVDGEIRALETSRVEIEAAGRITEWSREGVASQTDQTYTTRGDEEVIASSKEAKVLRAPNGLVIRRGDRTDSIVLAARAQAAAISQDGDTLAFRTESGPLVVETYRNGRWDSQGEIPVTGASSISFVQNDAFLLIHNGGHAWLEAVKPQQLIAEACAWATTNLTLQEWTTYFPSLTYAPACQNPTIDQKRRLMPWKPIEVRLPPPTPPAPANLQRDDSRS